MLARVASVCLLLIGGRAIAQAPDAAWLKAIPAEADAAIRIRGLDAAKGDLSKMIGAMSPALAEQAGPHLEALVGQFVAMYGRPAAEVPMTALVRVAPPGGDGARPFAVIVKSDGYADVQKSFAGGAEVKAEALPEGVDKFAGGDAKALYSYKGDGFVVVGEDKTLVVASAKSNAGAGAVWPQSVAAGFLRGDVGLYVNVAALQQRFADQIEGAKQQFLGLLDQAPVGGGAAMKDTIKGFYGGIFDAVKVGDRLALSLDFEPGGLDLDASATVRPGSGAAKGLGDARLSTLAMIDSLPADASFYIGMSATPETIGKFQKMGISMLAPGGVDSDPAMKAAVAKTLASGVSELASASLGGVRNISRTAVADPKLAIEGAADSIRAISSLKGDANVVKAAKLTPAAETFKGFKFDRAELTIDLEKFAKLQPNSPDAAGAARKIFGGDTVTTWFGTDGKTVITTTATTWDAARALIDGVVGGAGGVASIPSFRPLRDRLPAKASAIILINAQGFARQMAQQMSAGLPGNVELKPGPMPAEVALFGGSISPSADGYQFRFLLPSANGPVFEKGLVPIFQQIQGKLNQ